MRCRNGFTLVELLVVIGIIAILTAILMPSLNRARDAALRVRCAGNLQQWGAALTNYVTDNRGDMPRTWGPFVGGMYPYHIRVRTKGPDIFVDPVAYQGILSLEMMGPYLRGVPANLAVGAVNPKRTLSGLWRCPASFSDLDTLDSDTMWDTNGFLYGDYCYFGRSDLWAPTTMTNPEEIMRKKPEANRLWMCDVLFRWAAPGASPGNPGSLPQWDYNHRRYGMGSNFHGSSGSIGTPQMSGMNQLYGDGHVVWKDSVAFNFALMGPPASNSAPVPGQGSHFVHGGGNDCFFY